MSDTDHRYGDAPLGKSVEEIEREGGNLVNSPVPGENRGDDGVLPVVIPPAVAGTGVGAPLVGGVAGTGNGLAAAELAVVGNGRLVEDGGDADDGTARANRDSSEGTV
ncbi:hypothetical protein [Deinococcus hopiensis]|nr:hypothetical protein [Deinococcus hopiensis]